MAYLYAIPSNSSQQKSLPTNLELFSRISSPDEQKCNKTKFQALVGSLLFIARMTRPDVAIHVNLLGWLAEDPSAINFQAATKVLTYLLSTKSEGVIIRRPSNLQLEAFADASYGDPEARSQTGVLMTMGQQPVGWYSRRQDILCLSITEAEYVADCKGVKDLAWGRQLLGELQVSDSTPILWTNSEGAKNLSQMTRFI